ncbi:DUF3231 family protein [Anaerobacillus alkaliphilus]|uniref:DUF3231 family protein n=1 Tax=Anaerobacillus alkaliphilus TaxID=1548597 RepID=A0A4V1LGY6_9BACI|nr:DUF3231 family protein [Anaerobacillus alkaliphilus]RXJ04365.1 DUF3231 family protein [Anaerobacillus alkaliphilus]
MKQNHIDLTASEMSYLWNTYQAQCMNYCILTYFDSIVEDEEIKKINQLNLNASVRYLDQLKQIFTEEQLPVPVGYSEADLTKTTERLYTDPFILYYQWFIAKGNLNYGSIAINTIAREDVFTFFSEFIKDALATLNTSRKLLLEKGLWVRAPYIPVPIENEYIKKESFLNGWLGDTRPLTGSEIGSIFYNIVTNTVGKTMMDSFIQVTESNDIKDYFKKGKQISQDHIDTLATILKKEELPVVSTWNAGITSSTIAPFSEKLMLSLVTFLNSQGMSNYGIGFATSMRKDVGVKFKALTAEVAKFAEDGVTMLIEKGWMEEPPQAPKKS